MPDTQSILIKYENNEHELDNDLCLNKVYDFTPSSGKRPQNDTSLLHDLDKIGKRALLFLDTKKQKIKAWPIMVDTANTLLPLYTSRRCRNCHHSYSTHPIGCPLKYITINTAIQSVIISEIDPRFSLRSTLAERCVTQVEAKLRDTSKSDFFGAVISGNERSTEGRK